MFLEICELEKYYGTGESRVRVLKGISAKIQEKQILSDAIPAVEKPSMKS